MGGISAIFGLSRLLKNSAKWDRECRRRVHRAAVPLRLKLNINQRRGYAAQS